MHFGHKRDHHAVFWKVVPSGEGTGGQHISPANVMTVESRESAGGSHVHLLCAALAALMVSFAEPSCSAATAIVRNWLCPSHTCVFPCLASPGPGRVVLTELGLGWVHCLCPPRMCLLVWQGSPLTTPQASKQPDFPQMGLCVYQHEVRPVSICLPQSPQHQALTQEVAVDPGGTAGISLQDLINQVAWKTFLSSPHTPHPLGD